MAISAVAGDGVEDVAECAAGHLEVGEMVAELAELVEHDVRRVPGQLVARVVDLLHVALGARGPHDVLRVGLHAVRIVVAHVRVGVEDLADLLTDASKCLIMGERAYKLAMDEQRVGERSLALLTRYLEAS